MSKKKAVIIQEKLDNGAAWDNFIAKEGLKVVDTYTEWCGPCRALEPTIKSIKTELSDPLVNFAQANASQIEAIGKYAGGSEPITLFYGGPTLLNVIRGANAPEIEKYTREALAIEHDIKDNGGERKEYVEVTSEPDTTDDAANETAADLAATPEADVVKTYTFAIIKPDVVQAEKADAIFADIAEAGFKAVAMDDVELTEDTVKAIFAHKEKNEGFQELIDSLTTGPSKTVVLANSSSDAVTAWSELISPTAKPVAAAEEPAAAADEPPKPDTTDDDGGAAEPDATEATQAPQSLLEKHGLDVGALFGSASHEDAIKEITAAFPDWAKDNLGEKETTADGDDADGSNSSDATENAAAPDDESADSKSPTEEPTGTDASETDKPTETDAAETEPPADQSATSSEEPTASDSQPANEASTE